MIKTQHTIKSRLLLLLLFFVATTTNAQTYWGSGSRDLYPDAVKGGRAALYSGATATTNIPFPTRGVHYVYAKAGETISIASSAQGFGTTAALRWTNRSRVRLYGPNGSQITLTSFTGTTQANATVFGNILNRNAEKAGPRLPNQAAGSNRYQAIYYEALQDGIYRVELDGTRTSTAEGGRSLDGLMANSAWTQGDDNNYIWAWDVSVANVAKNGWISGRVYTTVMNMDNNQQTFTSSSSTTPNGFFGKFKVLTRDGYVYNVDNNGLNGLVFTFMVNNRGFHVTGNPNTPSYTSVLADATNPVTSSRYQDPRIADAGSAVTQKIFYQLPDSSMPENSIGAVPGGQTWLRIPEKDLNVSTINVVGVEGSSSQLGIKGANIEFYNESGGDYYITIKPKAGSTTTFPTRLLTGPSAIGDNRIYWDGKDGASNSLPAGESDVTVELKLRGAEVHFPYIDVEQNAYGIILQLYNTALNNLISDKVYWNDTAIDRTVNGAKASPINASHIILPAGTSSVSNGHKWANNNNTNTTYTWGDERGVDTWTFIEGNSISVDLDVDIRNANLEVVSIISDKNSVVAGDVVTYTTTVRNNGQSNVLGAPFALVIPAGMELASPGIYTFNGGSCGTESSPLVFNTNNSHIGYKSKLNLPAGCTVTYTIKLKVKENIPAGNNTVYSTIMRPNDVTDPDATNNIPQDSQGNFVPPTNPFFECANNGLGGTCNNIKNTPLFVRTYMITNPMIRQRTK